MRSFVTAAALALVMLLAFPPVPADNDSLKVIVLVEKKEYSIGTNVEVTVLVYDGGVAVDPDSTPEVTILSAAPRGVPVFKFGNGLFKGNFTIQASDVVGNLVPVEASATLGISSDTDKTYNRDADLASIYLSTAVPGALKVSLYTKTVSDSAIRPGAGVTVAADVTVAGSPVQPDGFNLTAAYQDPDGGSHVEPINSSNPGTGRFEGAYPLPQVPYDLRLTITASALSGNLTGTASLSLDFNQFWVIYHNNTKTATSITFYLYAGDPSGRAVAGAAFDFSFWPDGNISQSKKGPAATTDPGGKTRISLEFESGTRTLTLEGYANASGKSQRFSATIDVSTAPSTAKPSTPAFEMVYVGAGDLYIPGKATERQYVAFNNSQPMKNQEIFTYIVSSPLSPDSPFSLTPTTLIAARPYTTDAQGWVSIPFTPPAYDAYLVFYYKTITGIHPKPSGYFLNHDSNDGNYYSETVDVVVASQRFSGANVKVQASPYKAGAPAGIKATLSGAEPEMAYAMWMPGNFDPSLPQGAPSADWQVWEGMASYLNRSSGGFSGSVTVPVFMPGEVKYTVVVFVTEKGNLLPQYGSATLPKASVEEPRTDAFSMQFFILLIIIIAAVGGTAGGLAYRRRRARAAASPVGVSKTIACPACGTPFTVVQGPQPVKIQCPKCGKTGTLPAISAAPAQQPAAQPTAAPATAPAAAAPAAAPGAGVRMAIPCPSCGTVFDIFRGTGPTRIRCPNCGKSGIIGGISQAEAAAAQAQAAGPDAMQVQMAAASPAQPMQAQAATDMPRPEPVVETRTIACPQCRNRFTIEKKEGPQQIKCPHCGKEGTIGRAPAPAQAQAPSPQPMAQQQLPMPQPAMQMQPAAQPAAGPYGRPAQPQYRGAPPAGPARQMAAGQPAQAPGAAAGRMINCPACRFRFPVGDPRRPIKVRCPNCGKEGTLRT
jgi:ribosomal protein S27E